MHGCVDAVEPSALMPEADDVDMAQFDQYLNTEVVLPDGNGIVRGTVWKWKLDWEGRPVGIANANLLLDTHVYQVKFPKGSLRKYDANIIAELIYSQINEDGH